MRSPSLASDAAETIEPDQVGELEAVAEGAAGGEDRIVELERAECDAEIGLRARRGHHDTSSKRNTGPSLQQSAKWPST